MRAWLVVRLLLVARCRIRPPARGAVSGRRAGGRDDERREVGVYRLRTDGTYVAANGRGRFTARTIAWPDGPYRDALRKTELGRPGQRRAQAGIHQGQALLRVLQAGTAGAV